jgi:hypothetical protein
MTSAASPTRVTLRELDRAGQPMRRLVAGCSSCVRTADATRRRSYRVYQAQNAIRHERYVRNSPPEATFRKSCEVAAKQEFLGGHPRSGKQRKSELRVFVAPRIVCRGPLTQLASLSQRRLSTFHDPLLTVALPREKRLQPANQPRRQLRQIESKFCPSWSASTKTQAAYRRLAMGAAARDSRRRRAHPLHALTRGSLAGGRCIEFKGFSSELSRHSGNPSDPVKRAAR